MYTRPTILQPHAGGLGLLKRPPQYSVFPNPISTWAAIVLTQLGWAYQATKADGHVLCELGVERLELRNRYTNFSFPSYI